MKERVDKRSLKTRSRHSGAIQKQTESNIKLKRKPRAPHNTTTYLISNRLKDNIINEEFLLATGGTMKGILCINNTLDCESTEEGSMIDESEWNFFQ